MNNDVNWEFVIFLLVVLYAIIMAAVIDFYFSKLLHKNKVRKELHKFIYVLFAVFFPFVGLIIFINFIFKGLNYICKSIWTIFTKGIYEK